MPPRETGLLLPDTASVLEDLATLFEQCPRCGTLQDLNEIWIEKGVWGGSFSVENKHVLCAPCDEDWRNFVQSREMQGQGLATLKELSDEFCQTPVGQQSAEFQLLWALHELSGLRLAVSEEKVRIMARLRARSRLAATQAQPTWCRIMTKNGRCPETDIVNLGMVEKRDGEGKLTGEMNFAGFCCRKTLDSKNEHKFYNPNYRHQRLLRYVGKIFLSDFYHAWLHLVGENPRVENNPRIMWAFRQAAGARR